MEEKDMEEKIANYLEYFAIRLIQLGEFYKENKIEDNTIIIQHLDEMAEGLRSVIDILGSDKTRDYFNQDGQQTLRDFKIRKIMDERD